MAGAQSGPHPGPSVCLAARPGRPLSPAGSRKPSELPPQPRRLLPPHERGGTVRGLTEATTGLRPPPPEHGLTLRRRRAWASGPLGSPSPAPRPSHTPWGVLAHPQLSQSQTGHPLPHHAALAGTPAWLPPAQPRQARSCTGPGALVASERGSGGLGTRGGQAGLRSPTQSPVRVPVPTWASRVLQPQHHEHGLAPPSATPARRHE